MKAYIVRITTTLLDNFDVGPIERADLLKLMFEEGVFDPRDPRVKRFEVSETLSAIGL
jgi:hypothetical protein